MLTVDADGLRDYIIDHGWITSFPDFHQSPDDYVLLNTENINDINTSLQSQITQLRIAGRYGCNQSLPSLDFSSFHFSQLESIFIGCYAFLQTREIQFKSILL